MSRWDAIVVGAGPAGSLTAYHLARGGARVLLADRARFPRDKPCGGGLTGRALRQLPFDVDPVVEDRIERVELRLRYRRTFARQSSDGTLVAMTQRRRLDLYLAERAVEAGAELRDGAPVTELETAPTGASCRVGGECVEAPVLVGADGANGVTARSLGLGAIAEHGVALEGNLGYTRASRTRFAGVMALELGVIPGGYGWIFPKGDHVNVGVGGWGAQGPTLRARLAELCAQYAIDPAQLTDVRGHRLPLRRHDAELARGRALLVGDAAGLIDPVSGDGMYEAFFSARLAAAAALDVLEGREQTLEPYTNAVARALGPLTSAGWGAKLALDRFPRLTFAILRLPITWRVLEQLIRGDLAHPGVAHGPERGAMKLIEALARRAGRRDPRFQTAPA